MIDPCLPSPHARPSGASARSSRPPAAAPRPPRQGFGNILAGQISKLTDLQNQAADASRCSPTGQATDPTAVVMAVERAQLAMQLAGQLRTKGVEALNDILHTQV